MTAVQIIGKEANRWEEQFHLGAEPEAQSEYGLQPETREQAMVLIANAVQLYGLQAVALAGRVWKQLLSQAIKGETMLNDAAVQRLFNAVTAMDERSMKRQERHATRLSDIKQQVQRDGLRRVADSMEISAGYLSRMLAGKRKQPGPTNLDMGG